jgi:hypothetical protein
MGFFFMRNICALFFFSLGLIGRQRDNGTYWDVFNHFNTPAMHPLDTLSKACSTASPGAIAPQLPGGQAVVEVAAVAAARGTAVVTQAAPSPAPVTAFPPLQPGEELVEIPWPTPCPKCNSYEAWWDILGGQHCQRCEAKQFFRGLRILRLVDRWKKTETRE